MAKCTSSDEPQPHRHVTRRDSDAIRILSDCGLHVEVVELKPAWTPGLCDFYTQHSSLFSVVLSDTTRADTESGGDIRRRTRSGQGASCQLPGAWDSPPPARRSVTYCKCKRDTTETVLPSSHTTANPSLYGFISLYTCMLSCTCATCPKGRSGGTGRGARPSSPRQTEDRRPQLNVATTDIFHTCS